jgi:NTE family protein
MHCNMAASPEAATWRLIASAERLVFAQEPRVPKPPAVPVRRARRAATKPARPTRGKASSTPRTARVDLALQGGGAHGAFTWGVLDRLLEETWLSFDGISGTSAGAMNAVVMADGLTVGGPAGARAALEAFWRRVSDAARLSPLRRGPLEILTGTWTLDYSPVFAALDLAARVMSPYDVNPMGSNPLRQILQDSVDFARLVTAPIKLFVTATNVRTGKGHIFRNADLTPDVLLASACLPTMFQAVEIDGEPYWDGGYSGNPSMSPLIRECTASDTILIQINPIERPGTPRSAREIHNRLNEIAFNSVLLKELQAGALLRRATDPGKGENAVWANMRLHRIASDVMLDLGYSSKLIAEWSFFCMLRDEGRKAAAAFLEAHGADLGVRSTLDIDALLTEG